VAIAEGAHFRGSIDMQKKAAQVMSRPQPVKEPVLQAVPQPLAPVAVAR
jgi:hypothetical protein